MASLSCAISCCHESPNSFVPHLPLRYVTVSVSSHSVSQTQPNYRFGLSIRPDMRVKMRKSPSHLLVSCLRDTKPAVVTHESWDELILNSDTPVLVEFFTSWCGPCRVVHLVIEEIATDYSGKLKCFMLDAENDLRVAEDYDIKAVPVVLLFKNGEKRDSVVGTMPKEFYVSAIEKVLAS